MSEVSGEFRQIIGELFSENVPKSGFTEDYYGRLTTAFLKRIAKSKHKDTHQWTVLRVGLRTLVNQHRSGERAAAKSPQKSESAKWKRRGIRLNDFKAQATFHKTQATNEIVQTVTSELCRWLDEYELDVGGVRLRIGDCDGRQLRAAAQKERAIASGHNRNADFYDDLADIVGDNNLVRSGDENLLFAAHNKAFGAEDKSNAA